MDGIEVNIQDEYEANEDSSKCTLQKTLYIGGIGRALFLFFS